MDTKSLQFDDNNVTAENIANKALKAIIHHSGSYQETLKINLQFLLTQGVNISLRDDLSSLPLFSLDNYKQIVISIQYATTILKSALEAETTTYKSIYPYGYQLN